MTNQPVSESIFATGMQKSAEEALKKPNLHLTHGSVGRAKRILNSSDIIFDQEELAQVSPHAPESVRVAKSENPGRHLFRHPRVGRTIHTDISPLKSKMRGSKTSQGAPTY